MRIWSGFATCLLLATACTPAESDDGKPDSSNAGVTVPQLAAQSDAPIDDQLIECTETKGNGMSVTQSFVITDRRVKSYSQMQNHARDMCDPGQAGCALGWRDGKIEMLFITPSGARNMLTLDPHTLEFEKSLTTASRGTETFSGKCTSSSLPAGITIE